MQNVDSHPFVTPEDYGLYGKICSGIKTGAKISYGFLTKTGGVVCVTLLLREIAQGMAKDDRVIQSLVVVAPVIEEIAFRWIGHGFLYLVQEARIRYVKKINSNNPELPKIREINKVYRVRVMAIVFGLAHAFDPATVPAKIIRCASATIGGLSLGYTYEKTDSLMWPILFHATHNSLMGCGYLGIISPITVAALAILFQLGLYLSVTDEKDPFVFGFVKDAIGQSCFYMQQRVRLCLYLNVTDEKGPFVFGFVKDAMSQSCFYMQQRCKAIYQEIRGQPNVYESV